MTTMTASATENDEAGTQYWVCWDRGGPCSTFKGSVHGWRCQTCIDRYLDDGAARWLARARKEQDKLRAKLASAPDPLTSRSANTDQRREGGQRYVPHPSGAGRAGEGGGPQIRSAPLG